VESGRIVNSQSGIFDPSQMSTQRFVDFENNQTPIGGQPLQEFTSQCACSGPNLDKMASVMKVNRAADLPRCSLRCLKRPAHFFPILQECPKEIDAGHERIG
jgi:hypothetical protein